jgi:predicted DNA binding protein
MRRCSVGTNAVGRLQRAIGSDRQLEVIRTAYYSGFFETPRRNTGEDVAETLGVSPSAFYQLNRTVQRKLSTALFEGTADARS